MKIITACAIASMCLICGCSSSSNPSTNVATPPTNVEIAKINIDSNNCITSNNAEAEFSYNQGAVLLKHLIWNCADYEANTKSFIEIFAEYDSVSACYRIADQYIDTGICNSVATVPNTITFSSEITDQGFPVFIDTRQTEYSITRWGGTWPGEYGVGLSPIVQNKGNVRIFGLQLLFSIDGQQFSSASMTSSLPPFDLSILPPPTWSPVKINPIFFNLPVIASGSQHTLTLVLKDRYGNVLDATSGPATAQF